MSHQVLHNEILPSVDVIFMFHSLVVLGSYHLGANAKLSVRIVKTTEDKYGNGSWHW